MRQELESGSLSLDRPSTPDDIDIALAMSASESMPEMSEEEQLALAMRLSQEHPSGEQSDGEV